LGVLAHFALAGVLPGILKTGPSRVRWSSTAVYDVTVAAVTGALPEAQVGRPATTGPGVAFLEQSLAHCASGTNAVTGERGTRLDFVSFHDARAFRHGMNRIAL
jgi:hypothetical protein